ncbi:MAG TPA: DUF1924 domain-containing protein [Pseudomonadales bacterium]|nr:DUF1924 domain-containing protein [Pseudomonadales bacterium]
MKPFSYLALLGFAASLSGTPAMAEQPADFINQFSAEAKQVNAGFSGFSAERGKAFFTSTHGNDWSCASCHTQNPLAEGKHTVTSKIIQPLSPNANSERFTNPAKVEKWFKRNCNDVLKRACTAQEKGDVLTYLLSVKS